MFTTSNSLFKHHNTQTHTRLDMAQMEINTPLTFTVRRRAPELIGPAKPTPRELKPLSDLDDQEGLRFHIPVIQFYRHDPKMNNKNPASVIREALGKVLVFYYPFAGRLKEGSARKLMVDCTGEGVLFIEAEADVTLKQFGVLLPPFPCFDELLYDVPGSGGVLDSPLLLIQVTRLLCGGFIFTLRLNHTMSDAPSLIQFMTALGEMARGASKPSTLPVWQRELLIARDPPLVTCTHHEYDQLEDTKGTILIPLDDMTHKLFFFGPTEMSPLRRFVPTHLKHCCTFEVLTSCLWRCRTIALQPDPEEETRVVCIINARTKFNLPLPVGYYGNVFAFPVAISTAKDLATKPLAHALELVMKAKSHVNEEYMRSIAELMVTKGRPHFVVARSYLVSDVRRAGFDRVDFGWGNAAYGGPAKLTLGAIPSVACFYIPFTNHKGESGIVVPICLPSASMKIFVNELNNMLAENVLQDPNLHTLSRL